MPTYGVSSEWVAEREDEMARLITACDQVDALRRLGLVLRRRNLITEEYYRDYRDTLDCIAGGAVHRPAQYGPVAGWCGMNGMTEYHRPLFDLQPITAPTYERSATIQERFEAWIAVNPHFWTAFVRLCLDMRRRGMPRWSSKAAVEVLRYQAYLQTIGDTYKISNDITSRLARKALAEVPELDGFFSLRELRTD